MNVSAMNGPINVRVKLVIPEGSRKGTEEYFNYDGCEGTILAPAGNGGAWVCFGEAIDKYVGCPIAWLSKVK